MKKTDRRGFFKQMAMVAGAVATRKILPEKEIIIKTDGIDTDEIFRGFTMSSEISVTDATMAFVKVEKIETKRK